MSYEIADALALSSRESPRGSQPKRIDLDGSAADPWACGSRLILARPCGVRALAARYFTSRRNCRQKSGLRSVIYRRQLLLILPLCSGLPT